MLLPDNIQPELSIYYSGSIIIKSINDESNQKIIDLYYNIKKASGMSFPLFVLCLDWLYLVGIAEIDEKGVVRKCS